MWVFRWAPDRVHCNSPPFLEPPPKETTTNPTKIKPHHHLNPSFSCFPSLVSAHVPSPEQGMMLVGSSWKIPPALRPILGYRQGCHPLSHPRGTGRMGPAPSAHPSPDPTSTSLAHSRWSHSTHSPIIAHLDTPHGKGHPPLPMGHGLGANGSLSTPGAGRCHLNVPIWGQAQLLAHSWQQSRER